MNIILIILLVFAIILKIYPPKKPNYYYGYQLGSAKKSMEHWKLANKYAANYLIFLYSFIIILSAILNYIEYEDGILVLSLCIIGRVCIYILIERKLKLKIS